MAQFQAAQPTGVAVAELELLIRTAVFKTANELVGWMLQQAVDRTDAALVGARPGMTVVDLCAGAGGKSLALAAQMENRGRLIACDIALRKLAELSARAARAGASMIETMVLAPGGKSEDRLGLLRPIAGSGQRVLVDAPCSGSGTWRRQPELRLRFDSERLAAVIDLQSSLMDEAADLTAPGGRLIYVTCSLLKAENENQCANFLARHPGWRPLDWVRQWADSQSRQAPESISTNEFSLQLAPHIHGCDGFFVSIFEAPVTCRAGTGSP